MIPALMIPLIFFIIRFNFTNFKIVYSFASIFFVFWIIKNVIISGCAIYPLEKSCITSFNWTDSIEAKRESVSGEAWSKDWPTDMDILFL